MELVKPAFYSSGWLAVVQAARQQTGLSGCEESWLERSGWLVS